MSTSLRLVYLLALLQVAIGPLVLCGVLWLGKSGGPQTTASAAQEQRLMAAVQMMDLSLLAEPDQNTDAADAPSALPHHPVPPGKPAKSAPAREFAKGKLPADFTLRLPPPPPAFCVTSPPPSLADGCALHRTDAPPIPPPEAA